MYKCDTHGELNSSYCSDCDKIINCDCSNLTKSRFKDLIIDCDEGERCVTIYIEHCETCGNPFDITW
jgi:hypothetical protein